MRRITSLACFGALLLALAATTLYSTSSASTRNRVSRDARPQPAATGHQTASRGDKSALPSATLSPSGSKALFPLLMPQAGPPAETIDTYEVVSGACTNTQKDSFVLGEQVCARVANAPLRAAAPLRRVSIGDTDGTVSDTADVTTNPQTLIITLPTSATTVVGSETVDNRGLWSATINSTDDNGLRAVAYFSVSDPTAAAADLAVYAASTDTEALSPGQSTGFNVYLANNGPDAAANVHVTQNVPPFMTFTSATAGSGTPFTCSEASGVVDCAPSGNLAKGASSSFTLNYSISSGAPSTLVNTDVNISSDTEDPRPASNSSAVKVEIRAANSPPATCSVACPDNITVNADTTNGSGDPGAIVNFSGNIETSGDCGTITSSPASGTFFPVGSTTVTVSSATGGGSCSFTVEVTNVPPPTITCPANIGVTAPDNACDATVDVGTPTFTGDGASVAGARNDGQQLNAPYPAGTTTITWTVTDSLNRKASCTQTVTVTLNDTTPPTITAPPNVIAETPLNTTGSCGVVVGETELGTPTTDDNCPSSVTVARTGVPAGSFFPVGTTTITYTATDGAGHTATAQQTVTVLEHTPPHILAPPDASYTCLSEVPAADPSQATSGDVILDVNGNPLPPGPPSDNCGVPVVTVTQTTNGAGSTASPLIITRVFTATDAAGNTASSTQTITVIDPTPPTIAAPANVTAYTGAGAASCSTVVSDATLGAASASDNCGDVTVTRSPTGNTFPVGDTTVTWTATDAAGNTATATQTVTVIDNTPPSITPPANVTAYTGAGAASCSTVVSDATLGAASASDNCAGVGAITRSGVPAGNVFPVGTTTVTYSVTDAHGNSSSATQTVTVIDNTPPVVTPPPNITVHLPLNSTATSMAVSYPTPATATDNCDGPIPSGGISYSPASGSTFQVGTTTVTVSATDSHGNVGTNTFTVTVLYDFSGFFSPVNNLPTLNVVNAGRAIPVKFSLSGNKGINIFAPNSPASGPITCNSNDPATDLTDTLSAGGSSLSYDASSDQYIYVWKTQSSWVGTCRQLVVTLNDGSTHTANFKFK